MPNRLIYENSPYLLQHSSNPVEWYPWGTEALETARREDKPIFLSIGYSACHWCHVMAHESFEDPDTAIILNQHFINIKVDREERPDLDSIYMQAVIAMTGQGGWPMSVFLTPAGQPFFGGTYFPTTRRYNLPSFRDVIQTITRLWNQDRQKLLLSAQQITEHIRSSVLKTESINQTPSINLEDAVRELAQSYDWQDGGWGTAPKFPQPMSIEFLVRQATRGNNLARDMAIHALHSMAKGGMYDLVGGGFSRYSTDNQWHVPHFEKMLYDNAQLALVYLHSYLITGKADFRIICEATFDFMIREMMHPLGGFFSSLDADSGGCEGAYYLWTIQEIQVALTDPHEQALAIAAYAITEDGNFEGKNILQRKLTDNQLAAQFSIPATDISSRMSALHIKLRAYRQSRLHPGIDDKIILFWNALSLSALAEAARYLQRSDYKNVAIRNGHFLLDNLATPNGLLRSWRAGIAQHNAYLEDYASLVLALLSLYQTDPNLYWFSSASALINDMVNKFQDPSGGFFDTPIDHQDLIIRPKNLQDNATPSGNSLAALALLQMHSYTGNTILYDLAQLTLNLTRPNAGKYPTAFSQWLIALDYAQGPTTEVAILQNPDDTQPSPFLDIIWSKYQPRLVTAVASYPVPSGSPAVLQNRGLVNGQQAAYVCHQNVCQYPITSAEELLNLLLE